MSDQETEQNTILAHTGSQMSHFGLAENEFPIVVHPTLLEVPKPKPYENSKRLTYPIEMGKITIFDHYEEFLVKMFTEELKLENCENFEKSENSFKNYNSASLTFVHLYFMTGSKIRSVNNKNSRAKFSVLLELTHRLSHL